LGKGLGVYSTDLFSSNLPEDGTTVLDLDPACIKENPIDKDQYNDQYYSSTKQVYEDLGGAMGLEYDLLADYTLKKSLGALTGIDSSKPVTGYAITLGYHTKDRSISSECLVEPKFTADLLGRFKALPSTVPKPYKSVSWTEYEDFVKRFGTHVVTSALLGSFICQYAFARGDKRYSMDDLKVKACALFSKDPDGIPACRRVTEDQLGKVNGMEMNSKTVIRGGTVDTRSKLLFSRTKELLETFKSEAKNSTSPISYILSPLWRLLKMKFHGTKHYAKAKNLEEFYKGMLNFGCPYKEIGGKEMQVFEKTPQSPDSNPTYQCKLRQQGCLADKDCHYVPLLSCSCNGPTCIEHKTVERGDGTVRKEPY
ncbi:predicted protein, partial [Nematostella vectensis]